MSKIDTTYVNTKIGFRRSDASDNQVDTFYIDDDSVFQYYDSGGALEASGAEMMYNNYLPLTTQTIAQGAASTVLSVVNTPSNIQWLIISMTSTMVAASFWLASNVKKGMNLHVLIRAGSCASGAVVFSTSGVSVVGRMGLDVSGFTLNNSTNSTAYVHLHALQDDEWSVINFRDGYVE